MEQQIPVTRSSMPPFEEYMKEIAPLWETRWLTNGGAKHQELEAELARFFESPHCTLFCNGHQALLTGIELFDFPRGSEVITTPFTFVSTTQSIVQAGLTPVFADIDPQSLTMDPEQIEALITPKTVAILPVHVYGRVCAVEAIADLAARYRLKVIYDAAHAFGVTYKGRSVTAWGDLSMFSFHATKVFHTIEGGALVYSDDEFVVPLQSRRNFGLLHPEEAPYVSGNTKLNEFQAAMGLCNLRYLADCHSARRELADYYDSFLSDHKEVMILGRQPDVVPNYAYYPIFFKAGRARRDEVFRKLTERGIIARKYFYPLTSEFSCFSEFHRSPTPIAAQAAASVICLPFYPDLSEQERADVVQTLFAALKD